MTDIFASITGHIVEHHRPWPRIELDQQAWLEAADQLGHGTLTLLGLWGESAQVHMAVADSTDAAAICVFSAGCEDGIYPSVGLMHPPAIRLERAARDLFGLIPEGLPDARPWLNHSPAYAFLPVRGAHIHTVPVGPVHAGIIESGHFRFSADGETVVRLEERLGYTHKGIEALLAGKTPAEAVRIAGRCSGDSTVAYAWAFSRAVEAATAATLPARAIWLRALMAELERLANHFGDIGAICNDAAFAILLAHCSMLRERVLRAAATGFGHRLMMNTVIPGGVQVDLAPGQQHALRALVADLRPRCARLIGLYEKTASLQDRTVGTGMLRPVLARQYGAGGYVGRASGRLCDARRWPGYPPYDALSFTVPVLEAGDVNARLMIRAQEVGQSLNLVEQILDGLPAGDLSTPLAPISGEGMALVEGFRGDVLAWVRLQDGVITRAHLRDPSWFQWPLLEAAIEGNIIADFPLCNKSFNCSYSGVDL